MKDYKHISHDERLLIVDDYNSGLNYSRIGLKRNRHRATIKRCIEKCIDKNTYVQIKGGYWKRTTRTNVERGDLVYKLNRKRCKKRRKLVDGCHWLTYIKEMTTGKHKSSPYDIIRKVDDMVFDTNTGQFLNVTYRQKYELEDITVCESTIYNAFHSKKVNTIHPYMMLKHYQGGKKYIFKEGKRTNGDSISLMRKELLERDVHCVWEGDCIVGKRDSKSVLFTLANRSNNDAIAIQMPNRTKTSVVNALNKLERMLGLETFQDVFSYIIFDSGVEFRDVDGIEHSCLDPSIKRTKIYFAHPYRSCERAINENGNRMFRKYFPKGTNFDKVTEKNIWIANMLINLTHRKRLNGKSSYELGSIITKSNLSCCTWT